MIEVDPPVWDTSSRESNKRNNIPCITQEFPWLRSRLPSLWTNSYFVSTVGGAPLSVIKQYIENQKNV